MCRRLERVDPEHLVALGGKTRRNLAVAAADVEHAPACPHESESDGVARARQVLQRVAGVVLGELRGADAAGTGAPVAQHRRDDIACVTEALDAADLVAIVRGDRNLDDPHALVLELDDDLGVEVEVIGHRREVDLLQRAQRVRPVAGVELREVHVQRPVLEAGEDPVSGELVQGHAASEGRQRTAEHSRPEDRVGLASDDRLVQLIEDLRRVLAVSV
jgi:hypothetical protein